MAEYLTTREFPAELTARIGDLIPRHCRSVKIGQAGVATDRATAHRSEIGEVRRAIRIARREAETVHIR
jgi:hypothetical protein